MLRVPHPSHGPSRFSVQGVRFAFFAGLLAVAVTAAVIYVADALSDPVNLPWDPRPLLLCLSLTGLNVVTYAVWPSRWNIVAHTQLAFSIVAYWIPIFFLHGLSLLPTAVLNRYFEQVIAGFGLCLIGTLAGAMLASDRLAARITARANFGDPDVMAKITRRVKRAAWMSVAAIAVSFAVMGFIPAFTPDPLIAKFFRGSYAAAYAPVAPLYRLGTTAVALLLPLTAVNAWRRKTLGWWAVLAGSLLMMLFGLMRSPAVAGLLLAVGIAFAVRGRHMITYMALLLGAYFIGGALYTILGDLGLSGFTATASAPQTFLAKVAGGAPDINDQVNFLQAWFANPQYTHGLTFIGGLVPSNYHWNPSVWSLQVVNPGAAIANIDSGGLRLPAPIWGYVSFGWKGLVGVSFLTGVIGGYLAALFRRLTPSDSVIESTCWLVIYYALLQVVPVFFRLSYLSVLQLLIVWAILFWGTRPKMSSYERMLEREVSRHYFALR